MDSFGGLDEVLMRGRVINEPSRLLGMTLIDLRMETAEFIKYCFGDHGERQVTTNKGHIRHQGGRFVL